MPETTKAARLRRSQIDILLKEIESEGLKDDSVLVAGAFNAQLFETHLLSDMASTQRATSYARKSSDGRLEGIEQRDRRGRSVLTVETHRFDLHSIHDWFFRLGRGQMVKKYNGELAQVVFGGKLLEESVFFQPSRHYGINKATEKEEFMKNLCPAWADRVLYNEKLSDLFRHDSFCASGLYYGLVAEKKYVGQHKPVALHATICLK
uniref:Endo/exonuclease/phosphatase domain-containing protein n=1 Tax=Elaeophora elaphi TaxID=1147741 RepID=A0A0R3S6J1_9BILA